MFKNAGMYTVIHHKNVFVPGDEIIIIMFLQFTTASVSKAVSDLKNHISTKQAPVVESDDGDLDGILNRLSLSGKQIGVCVNNHDYT